MSDELWRAVDAYIGEALVSTDDHLERALEKSARAGLPPIHVSPSHGKLLHLLARAIGARRILEIGTLGGYSTIWLARALPHDGLLVTLESEMAHAEVAQVNLANAGLGDLVEIRVGRALESLADVSGEGYEPFDLTFIDADKPSNPKYFEWALRLSRPGALIVIDNVVRGGSIIDGAHDDARVRGTRELFERIASEPRVSATAVQTVGDKGHDGFALCVVNE